MKLIKFNDTYNNIIFVSPEQVVYIKQYQDNKEYLEILLSTGDKINVKGTLTKDVAKLTVLSTLEGIIKL